jgi:hypothetical protein
VQRDFASARGELLQEADDITFAVKAHPAPVIFDGARARLQPQLQP